MELKLTVYKDRLCRTVDKTVTANVFDLSTGICEDVLNILNIDMLANGMDNMQDEDVTETVIGIIRNGYPFFVDLIQEIFELTEEEVKKTRIEDIGALIMGIARYAFGKLAATFGNSNSNGKN